MLFSLIALFAILAGTAFASPMSLMTIRDCDVALCAIALGPTVVGCGVAAIEVGANPIADIGCLAGVLNAVVNTPALCTGCAEKLGIDQVAKEAESVVGGAVDDVEDAFNSIF